MSRVSGRDCRTHLRWPTGATCLGTHNIGGSPLEHRSFEQCCTNPISQHCGLQATIYDICRTGTNRITDQTSDELTVRDTVTSRNRGSDNTATLTIDPTITLPDSMTGAVHYHADPPADKPEANENSAPPPTIIRLSRLSLK